MSYSFLVGSATPGPLTFTMTSDFRAASDFVDSNLIVDIESRMNVKLDPPVMIAVAGHSTFSGVKMGTLAVRVIDGQGFLHDMLLPAMNVPGFGRHLFKDGRQYLKEKVRSSMSNPTIRGRGDG